MLAKYRLLRRGLVIACLFAFNLGIYGAFVFVASLLFGSSPNVVPTTLILATFVTVLVMSRLRTTAETITNWLAFGERANAYRVAATLATQIANTLAVDDVLPTLAEATARSTQSRRAEVRLWLPEGGQWSQVWPVAASDTMSDVTVTVRHGGDAVGELRVNPSQENWDETGRQVLDALARPAGLALASVKLTYELRQRLEEIEKVNSSLRASQARIVEAHRRERLRISSDVSEMVQPHLVASQKALEGARGVFDSDGSMSLAGMFGDAREHGTDALESLRRISRGIYPVQLFNAGIVAALQTWVIESGRAVTMHTSGDFGLLRDHPEVEATLFFSCVRLIEEFAPKDQKVSVVLELNCADSGVDFCIRGEPASDQLDIEVTGETLQSALDQIHGFGGSLTKEVSSTGLALVGVMPLKRASS